MTNGLSEEWIKSRVCIANIFRTPALTCTVAAVRISSLLYPSPDVIEHREALGVVYEGGECRLSDLSHGSGHTSVSE